MKRKSRGRTTGVKWKVEGVQEKTWVGRQAKALGKHWSERGEIGKADRNSKTRADKLKRREKNPLTLREV